MCLAWAPGAAFAAEPGVTVDPHSPAGTEYQLPLDHARDDASGGHNGSPGGGAGGGNGGSNGSGGQSAGGTPLFGAGVGGSSGSSGSGGSAGSGGSGSGGDGGPGRHITSPGSGVAREGKPALAGADLAAASADAGSSWTPLLAAIAGFVVIAGLALGALWRRRTPLTG
jgi:hypothetical protein